jgi:hypothetical protein
VIELVTYARGRREVLRVAEDVFPVGRLWLPYRGLFGWPHAFRVFARAGREFVEVHG